MRWGKTRYEPPGSTPARLAHHQGRPSGGWQRRL